MRIVVGIDEVGRGPVAGPVSVGIVVLRQGDTLPLPGLRDSKQMTEKARERVYAEACILRESGVLRFGVYSVTAEVIDARGISTALRSAIATGLADLAPEQHNYSVLLDGSLKAPKEYEQQTIIRGDSLIPAISLASVVAKVERDRYMAGEAEAQYPTYGFARHKGYGTAAHLAAIKEYGLSPLHRSSFLTRLVVE